MEANGTNMVIPLYQETINVGKREISEGAVRLRKVVKSETVNQPVQLRHEELVIDRVPAGQAQAQGQNFGQPFQEQETVIRLQGEQPVVEKQMTPAGNIVVQRRDTAFQTNVQAQVRREDVDIVKMGNSQNIIIGQNLQSSTEPGAAGGAGEIGGQSAGGGSNVGSGTISDPTILSTAPDAAAFNGRTVNFKGVRVQRVLGDRLVMLSTENGKPFFALSNQNLPDVNAGEMVNLTGTLRQTPQTTSDLGLSGDAAQALRGQPLYIDSAKIEMPNQNQ